MIIPGVLHLYFVKGPQGGGAFDFLYRQHSARGRPNLRFFTEPIVRFGANLGQLHVRFGIVW